MSDNDEHLLTLPAGAQLEYDSHLESLNSEWDPKTVKSLKIPS